MNDKKEIKNFVPIREASRLTGLGHQTIRKMADDGTIKCYKTPTGQRRIDIQSIQEFCSTASNVPKEPTLSKKNFIYARVSTKKTGGRPFSTT
jgi:excisionase family DNA binding protein